MKEQHPFPINNDQTSEQVDVSAVELLQSGEKVFAPELIEGNKVPVFHDGPTSTVDPNNIEIPELNSNLHEVTQADLDANPELKDHLKVGDNVQIVEEPLVKSALDTETVLDNPTGNFQQGSQDIEADSQESGVESTATGIPTSDEGAE